jgi:hypothetical protein
MKRLALVLCPTLTLAACGGGLSPGDATKGRTAAVTAISSAAGRAQMLRQAQEGNVMVSGEFDCSGGGKINITGSVFSSSGTGGANAEMDVSATFTGCKETDVVMDGSLRYKFDIDVSMTGAAITLIMDGTVTFSGGVVGECVFDVNIEGFSSASGEGGGSAEGSICGVDISEAGGVQ